MELVSKSYAVVLEFGVIVYGLGVNRIATVIASGYDDALSLVTRFWLRVCFV
jgi:hypothetical protein